MTTSNSPCDMTTQDDWGKDKVQGSVNISIEKSLILNSYSVELATTVNLASPAV